MGWLRLSGRPVAVLFGGCTCLSVCQVDVFTDSSAAGHPCLISVIMPNMWVQMRTTKVGSPLDAHRPANDPCKRRSLPSATPWSHLKQRGSGSDCTGQQINQKNETVDYGNLK